MKTLKEYWDAAFQRPGLSPRYDDWLDKYHAELERSRDETILDLGCGAGNNCLYLSERGYKIVACDISEDSVNLVKRLVPDIETRRFDMAEGLPFEDGSFRVAIADLSLHYFAEGLTRKVIADLHRILTFDGILLCRLNSTGELHKDIHTRPAPDDPFFYESEGIYRRFFDRGEIDRFFGTEQWEFMRVQEYELERYDNKKVLWELALKKKS